MTEGLRLFIAVPIDLTVGENANLHAALKKLRIGADKREMEIYWSPSSGFHVTLCFLGATPFEQISILQELLTRVASETVAIDSSLKGLGAFPDEHHARVLWVGIRKSRALAELQERLRAELVTLNFAQEDREYRPHLTIGRLRKARAVEDLLSPFVRTKFGELKIGRVTLYKSVMHGSHPVYEPISHHDLTGSPTVHDE